MRGECNLSAFVDAPTVPVTKTGEQAAMGVPLVLVY